MEHHIGFDVVVAEAVDLVVEVLIVALDEENLAALAFVEFLLVGFDLVEDLLVAFALAEALLALAYLVEVVLVFAGDLVEF